MSDFGFAEAERNAKERLQKEVERLIVDQAKYEEEIDRLQARIEALEAKDAEWKKAAYKAQQIILGLEAKVEKLEGELRAVVSCTEFEEIVSATEGESDE